MLLTLLLLLVGLCFMTLRDGTMMMEVMENVDLIIRKMIVPRLLERDGVPRSVKDALTLCNIWEPVVFFGETFKKGFFYDCMLNSPQVHKAAIELLFRNHVPLSVCPGAPGKFWPCIYNAWCETHCGHPWDSIPGNATRLEYVACIAAKAPYTAEVYHASAEFHLTVLSVWWNSVVSHAHAVAPDVIENLVWLVSAYGFLWLFQAHGLFHWIWDCYVSSLHPFVVIWMLICEIWMLLCRWREISVWAREGVALGWNWIQGRVSIWKSWIQGRLSFGRIWIQARLTSWRTWVQPIIGRAWMSTQAWSTQVFERCWQRQQTAAANDMPNPLTTLDYDQEHIFYLGNFNRPLN
ncbi:expressed unknown protein [Seminavis robusta]|uniref:Uncharacterized protein n=1 Tax=Seminavis robusta TaxID=568900 RepID=A0A9N8EFN3_9STRA|nr:expressed unknown protein [Seminavis robusta]|eukprot:Sro1054_g235960.1 n/a (350) ;mRNA; f:14122-15171